MCRATKLSKGLHWVLKVNIARSVLLPKLLQLGPFLLGLLILAALYIRLASDIDLLRRLEGAVTQSDPSPSVSVSPLDAHQSIALFNLMGKTPAVQSQAEFIPPEPLPVQIHLKGTFTDTLQGVASALISVNGGMAKRHFVGDEIYEGIVLAGVDDDKVMLQQGSSTRQIYFPFSEKRMPAVRRNRRTVINNLQESIESAETREGQEKSLTERIRELREQHEK